MKIDLRGEMTLASVRQALFETLNDLEDEYAVRFSRGATLYLNPTDGKGEDVVARSATGCKVQRLSCKPYRCAADDHKL